MISIFGRRAALGVAAVVVFAQEANAQMNMVSMSPHVDGCNLSVQVESGPIEDPDYSQAVGSFKGDDWQVRLFIPPGDGNSTVTVRDPNTGLTPAVIDFSRWRSTIRNAPVGTYQSAAEYKIAQWIAANAPDLSALGHWINNWEGEGCPSIEDIADWVDEQDCDGDGIPDWVDEDNCDDPGECVEMMGPNGESCWDCDGDGECDCWRLDDDGKCTCEDAGGCGCDEVDLDGDGEVDCWDCDGDGYCDCYAVDPDTGECECENPEGCDGGSGCGCERITDPNSIEGHTRYCWDCDGDGYCDCWQYNEEACECMCDCDPADEGCDCGCEPGEKLQQYLTQMQQMFLQKLGLENWEDLNWAGEYIVWEIPIPVPGQGHDYYRLPLVPRLGVSGPEDALHYLRIVLRGFLLFLCALWMVRKVFETLRQY